jgi:hypothetical protein
VINAKSKGYRTVALGRRILEEQGYIVANLEKTGKFVKEKDLFGLWDALSVRGKYHIFTQYKTNMESGKKKYRKWLQPYIAFGKLHSSEFVRYDVRIYHNRRGWEVIECV